MILEAGQFIKIQSGTNNVLAVIVHGLEIDQTHLNIYRKLSQTLIPNTPTTIYTAPAGYQTIVRQIEIINPTVSDATVMVWQDGADNAHLFLVPVNLPAGGMLTWTTDSGWKMFTVSSSVANGLYTGRILAADFSGSPFQATVNFTVPYSDANYSISAIAVVSGADAAYVLGVLNQTQFGFAVSINSNDKSGLVEVSWLTKSRT